MIASLSFILGLARNSLTNRIFDLRRGTCGLRSSALRPSPSLAPSSSSSDRCSFQPTICATACSRRSKSATGYRLRVSGPVQVSLFPSLDLVAEDVGIAQSGAAATCRDGDGQIAPLRLAAIGADRRQGQDDRGHADRSGHRRAASPDGGQGRRGCSRAASGRWIAGGRAQDLSASTSFSSRTAR